MGSFEKCLSEVIQILRKQEANWNPPRKKPETVIDWKLTNNWSAENLKITKHLSELNTWASDTVMWH